VNLFLEKNGLVDHIQITAQIRLEIRRAEPLFRQVNSEIKKGFSATDIEGFKKIVTSVLTKFNRG
jgi:hypothetical protein